jgi:hypothetical protein
MAEPAARAGAPVLPAPHRQPLGRDATPRERLVDLEAVEARLGGVPVLRGVHLRGRGWCRDRCAGRQRVG